ncbi:MAG: 2Fe-2S iron-sulfur cluster-binding protein [Anaerolineae bacterium]
MSYEVRLVNSGKTFVIEDDETVLEAAEKAGIVLSYSCRGGTCRSCMTHILTGQAEHDPEYADELSIDASEIADGYRLLCSTLAYSDLELER